MSLPKAAAEEEVAAVAGLVVEVVAGLVPVLAGAEAVALAGESD
jgi:hypothetical protein